MKGDARTSLRDIVSSTPKAPDVKRDRINARLPADESGALDNI